MIFSCIVALVMNKFMDSNMKSCSPADFIVNTAKVHALDILASQNEFDSKALYIQILLFALNITLFDYVLCF